jgi:hypothetical protein
MKILAIDLGKFKSVACLFDTETNQSQYETIPTVVFAIKQLLQTMQPNKVMIETCTISGWVYDLCKGHGFEGLAADPSQEVALEKHKDDALKLAKLAALEQINPVYVPAPESRQYRH